MASTEITNALADVENALKEKRELLAQAKDDFKAVEDLLPTLGITKEFEFINDDIQIIWRPEHKRLLVRQSDGTLRNAVECKVELRLLAYKYLVSFLKELKSAAA